MRSFTIRPKFAGGDIEVIEMDPEMPGDWVRREDAERALEHSRQDADDQCESASRQRDLWRIEKARNIMAEEATSCCMSCVQEWLWKTNAEIEEALKRRKEKGKWDHS